MTYLSSPRNPRFLSLRSILQMSVLITRQDESIDYIQNTALDIEQDASKGYVSSLETPLSIVDVITRVGATDKAVASARAARKKRWICFGLFVLLLIIIAAVVAGVVVTNNKK